MPYAHFPKFLQMDSGVNEHLKERDALGGLKGYLKSSVPIYPTFLQMGRGKNWHLGFRGKEDFWGKGIP